MFLKRNGCIVNLAVDNAIDSCGFTCTPRKKKFPNFKKPTTARKSPKKASIPRKPSVTKIIHKANVGKEGDSMFQGLGSLLTVLCKSVQGDIASISVDLVTSDTISNVLQNGANGGSVLATKLDDSSVTTFPTWYAIVLKTVDKHAFSTTESNYIYCYDLNNSNNVASDCIVLDNIDSTFRAESSTVDNKNYVNRDIAVEVVGAFVSNNNEPMLKYEKREGALHDEYNADVKKTDVPPPPKERDSQKRWGLSIKWGCTTHLR